MCAKRVGRETCLTTKQQLHSTAVIWDAYDRACIMLVIQRGSWQSTDAGDTGHLMKKKMKTNSRFIKCLITMDLNFNKFRCSECLT